MYEHFGNSAPAPVWNRCWLVMSLAQLDAMFRAMDTPPWLEQAEAAPRALP